MLSKKTILVTGGLGYIGSHTIIELYNQDYIKSQNINEEYEVIIIDNFSNCEPTVLETLEKILNKKLKFYNIDIADKQKLEIIFKENKIDRVIHFAASKSVAESVKEPLKYYRQNLVCSLNLIELCKEYKVNEFIYSSTCAIYGETNNESDEYKNILLPESPYGRSKLYTENMLKDFCKIDKNFKAVILRYCNVVGNHPSGEIGEQPKGNCTMLFPIIAEHIKGIRPKLYLFGNDYPTKDGYCIRDFTHVIDLAHGHIAAMKVFFKENEKLLKDNIAIYNLGTNSGNSVKEVVDTYQKVNNLKFDIEITERRPGDVSICCPNCNKAWKELGWKTEKTLEDICRDSYNFILKNPNGI